MIQGFKDFIARGNVVDLAVAVVIGGAFALVISAVVDGLVSPLVAAIFGEPDLTSVATFTINGAVFSFGLVLDALFNFLAVAAAIYFVVVMPLNKLAARRKKSDAVVEEAGPTEVELLMEIRDELKARPRG